VRSLRNTYVYATSPTALARLKRLAGDTAGWTVPEIVESAAKLASGKALSGAEPGKQRLVLEAFDFAGSEDAGVKTIAEWLAKNALPQDTDHAFFRQKLTDDLVVLSDTAFTHFVRHATVVEAHVAIDNDTGAAKRGALFYTENLPPETLLAGLLLSSVERQKKGNSRDDPISAETILAMVLRDEGDRKGLSDNLLQVGGDATTGRGLIVVHAANGGA